MATSIGIHAALVLLFFFMIAWKAPNPPAPEYGIELNFGTSEQGSGPVQPTEPVGSQGQAEQEPNQPEEQEAVEPETPKVEETRPVEQQIVSKVESPVAVKEEKKEVVKEPQKPIEKTEPKKEEPVKPKVNEEAVFKPRTQTSNTDNKTAESKAGQAGNQGDDTNKAGDKGSPEGKPNPDAAYTGKAGGGGGGYGLSMPGWAWASPPEKKKLSSNFSGKIRFEIEVDEDGQIIKITTLERTLNLEDERLLRQAIERSQLEKTSAGNAPARSKGVVEFTLSLE